MTWDTLLWALVSLFSGAAAVWTAWRGFKSMRSLNELQSQELEETRRLLKEARAEAEATAAELHRLRMGGSK